MTIALATICTDGLVMCADTQVGDGNHKFYEPKIFPIPYDCMSKNVLLAYAGSPDKMKSIVQNFRSRIIVQSQSPEQIQSHFQDVLDAAFRKKAKEAHQVLCAFACGGEFYLLKSWNNDISPVNVWDCIGFGDSALIRYLGNIFLGTSMHLPIHLAVPICDYLIAQAKKYIQWCGGDTNLVVLTNDGKLHEQFPSPDIDVLCDRIEYRLNMVLTTASAFDISEEQCLRLIKELRELLHESEKTFGRLVPELKTV